MGRWEGGRWEVGDGRWENIFISCGKMSQYKRLLVDAADTNFAFYVGSGGQAVRVNLGGPRGRNGIPGKRGSDGNPGLNGKKFSADAPSATFQGTPQSTLDLTQANTTPLAIIYNITDPNLDASSDWDTTLGAVKYLGPPATFLISYNYSIDSSNTPVIYYLVVNGVARPLTQNAQAITNAVVVQHQLSGSDIVKLSTSDQIGVYATTPQPPIVLSSCQLPAGRPVNISFKCLSGTLV